jgi:hypothetical protein
VSRAIQILKDEMEMDLRLIGAPTLKDVTRNMIDTTQLSNRGIESQPDFLYRHNVSLRERAARRMLTHCNSTSLCRPSSRVAALRSRQSCDCPVLCRVLCSSPCHI